MTTLCRNPCELLNTFTHLMTGNILLICPFIVTKQAVDALTADEWLFVDSSSPSFYCCQTTSMKSVVVSCSWLMINSTSGRMVHFMLSRNYPEIHGCQQHLLPCQEKVLFAYGTLGRNVTDRFKQLLNVQRSLSASTTTLMAFRYQY